jgi:hypothetical protein
MLQLALVRNIEESHERVVIIVNLAIEKRLDRQFELVGRERGGVFMCGQDREGEKRRYLVFPVVIKMSKCCDDGGSFPFLTPQKILNRIFHSLNLFLAIRKNATLKQK